LTLRAYGMFDTVRRFEQDISRLMVKVPGR